jgi:CTP synthase (UTP-ammonia lyase)
MERPIALALVGEYTPSFVPHAKTDAALDQMRSALGIEIDATWISAANLDDEPQSKLSRFHGIWVAPGSPYKSMQGALNAIRHSREHGIPLLGTCGGCQHVVIEYARNVLGFYDAQHAEYDPYASNLFVTPLSCSLVGQRMEVHIEAGSRVAAIYGTTRVSEEYYCNFGLNPEHQQKLHEGGLHIVGCDANGEARILTVPQHPFFLATLFVPQLTSTIARPHPLIVAFLRAAELHAMTTVASCS